METTFIVSEFETGLRAFVRSRVSNSADADDLLQDILLKLHRASDKIEDDERVAGWVFRVARNAITDHYRKSGRNREFGVDEEHASDAESGFEESAEAELAHCVRPFVNQLAPPYRDAVRMVDFDGLTHAEAAKAAGVSVSGMKSRVQRGRTQLRAELEDCCRIEQDIRGKVVGYEPHCGTSEDCWS